MTTDHDDLAGRKRGVPTEFNRIARSYDLMARLNPGYHKHLRWSAERLGLGAGARVLDLCCGTGLSTGALRQAYPDAEIVGLDASPGMLEVARRKSLAGNVTFLAGDATDPAAAGATGPFDGILMAYGIRNLPDPDRCLANLFDLLAPGGAICFHEYSVADSILSQAVWNAVTCGVIIPLGGITARTTEIYRYLRRSVLAFDGVQAFEERLRRAGFAEVHTEPMSGWERGIVHSFLGRRPR